MAIRKHSRVSASSAFRWLKCPGSVRMQTDIPDSPSEAADLGTAAHELGEMCLSKGTQSAAEHLGRKILVEQSGREFIVDQEMVDGVQLYIDTVRKDRHEMLPGVKAAIEKKFHLDWLHKEIYGTNDAYLSQEFGLLRVYDLKYGRGVIVEPEDNAQMKIYALGAKQGSTCEEVELVIVQPRAPHSEGPVRRWRISVEDLDAWALGVLKPGAERALTNDAPVKAGVWCKFCRALPVCPEVRKKASEVAKVAFDDPEPVFPAPAALTGEELAKAVAFSKMFSSWGKEVEAYAKAMLERGMKIEGFKLVRGKASRSWRDESQAITELGPQYGTILYTDPKFKTVAQVETAIKESTGLKVKEVKELVAGFVDISKPLTMVPVDDKRAEVLPAIAAFDDNL